MLVGWVGAGILFLASGFVAMGSTLGGIVVFLVALFAVPPIREQLQTRLGVSLSVWMLLIIIVGGLFLGAHLMPFGDESVQRHSTGDSFTVVSENGTINYTVDRVRRTKATDEYLGEERADGVFVIVDLHLTNVGNQTVNLSATKYTLVAADGTVYEPEKTNNILFDTLAPDLAKESTLVFDVPTNRTQWSLRIEASEQQPHVVPLGNETKAVTKTP
jgi:hypothetical protein